MLVGNEWKNDVYTVNVSQRLEGSQERFDKVKQVVNTNCGLPPGGGAFIKQSMKVKLTASSEQRDIKTCLIGPTANDNQNVKQRWINCSKRIDRFCWATVCTRAQQSVTEMVVPEQSGPKRERLLCPFPWEGWVPMWHNVAWAEAYVFRTNWYPDSSSRSAHVYCGQTAWWIRIPLGTEIGSAASPTPPLFVPPLLCLAPQLLGSFS